MVQTYRIFALAALALACGGAQPLVPIRDLSARSKPMYGPAHEGRQVTVRGIVAGPVVRLRTYSHALLQDDDGAGITMEGPRDSFDALRPGDRLEVAGVIGNRAGLPILRPERTTKIGSATAPPAQPMRPSDLVRYDNLGRYVVTETHVITAGSNAGGDLLVVGEPGSSLNIFLPREQRSVAPGLRQFRTGDTVRIVGHSSQYCPVPPYDHDFQILIGEESAVTLVSRGWLVSPNTLIYTALGIVVAAFVWWRRERRLARRRQVLQAVMNLSEDAISASSPREIARRVQGVLPKAIGAETIEIYMHNRTTNRLERVAADSTQQPLSVSVDEPIGTFHSAVALCFRNRALLHVPDTRRSPILTGKDANVPAAAVFVPMMAQRELIGTMAAYFRKSARHALLERHAALQHLANQVAASLKLQEQQHMREQLMRSEKMAAAGQLISGVANDLRTPLENISKASRLLLGRTADGQPELHEIASDAERGLDIVGHLVSFARMERSESKPIDIYGLVNSLLDIRQQDRERKGVRADISLPVPPLEVLADQAQLEQAFLTVLVHVEHAASQAVDKTIHVSSRVVGRKVQIAFDCNLGSAIDPFTELAQGDYFGMPVAQAIAQSHGGDIRFAAGRSGFRLEFDLPVHTTDGPSLDKPAPSVPKAVRVLTALIVEPDPASQRKLLTMLAARGHRAIPAPNAEDAADLVQRMTFDVVFCAVRLSNLNWVEFFQRVRRRIGAFALLTEGYDAESARAFKGGEGHILSKPLEERDLDNFLGLVEVRLAASRR